MGFIKPGKLLTIDVKPPTPNELNGRHQAPAAGTKGVLLPVGRTALAFQGYDLFGDVLGVIGSPGSLDNKMNDRPFYCPTDR